MIYPAAMAVDGGNANGKVHMAHAVAGEGPNIDRSTDPEMLGEFQASGSYYAHVGRLRLSLGSRSLMTRVCTTSAPATALLRTLGVFTRGMRPCRALLTCCPNMERPGMLVTAWPRSMVTRSSGTRGRSAVSTRLFHFATRSFATKCLCTRSSAWCTPTLCCCPCGGRIPLRRRPTHFAACCGTGRRPSSPGARWPRTLWYRSPTTPV